MYSLLYEVELLLTRSAFYIYKGISRFFNNTYLLQNLLLLKVSIIVRELLVRMRAWTQGLTDRVQQLGEEPGVAMVSGADRNDGVAQIAFPVEAGHGCI